ncbi:MAG: hypothetical protein DBY38_10175 [Clostridium cadaveris]|uniref:Uncharacterized protein n=1 Tax=Clostridium cadaveris TaxID=1529 RepID=A0A316M3J6_9CLOT|nr:MAG: hypothetical protein DBY38_10175 [Clostridium cadaveris]
MNSEILSRESFEIYINPKAFSAFLVFDFIYRLKKAQLLIKVAMPMKSKILIFHYVTFIYTKFYFFVPLL